MSVVDTLITDRTQADVDAVKALSAKDMSTWTPVEVTEYLNGMKGAYNATDLNRVGNACAYLYAEIAKMGTFVSSFTPPKTDWTIDDVPTAAQMQAYLNDIAALKAQWSAAQTIPQSMSGIDYEDANDIEKLLTEVDSQMHRMYAVLIRCEMRTAFCGTGYYFQS